MVMEFSILMMLPVRTLDGLKVAGTPTRWKYSKISICLKSTLPSVSKLKKIPTGKFFFDLAGQPTTQGAVRHHGPATP
jgi:hypothetical protein